MADIALPSSPQFKHINPIIRNSSRVAMSPINYTQQVYNYKGTLWVCEFVLPVLDQSDLQNWVTWAEQMEGSTNTFTADVSLALPGVTGANSMKFRLVSPDIAWNVREATKTEFSFVGMEAK